jgi:excisionase family DNA binding protein
MPEELSPSEVARRLGTSTRTVQRWIARGQVPARRVGGRWRVAFDVFDVSLPPTGAERRAIRTLFIANRGEIAARITRTCDRSGIRAVVPTTDGPGALDLLDAAAVTDAAVAAGADAVHPGFGFLAENADFADRVGAAGLRWVGPPSTAIRAMGDKAAARRLAAQLGVPVPAGYDGADQTDAALTAAARQIGIPLLIKPAAGGGGKGMRTVRDPARLTDDLAASRREAMAAFGDDRLVLERLIEGARHVEIQVLFDAHGAGVHLGERDCSIQRRHQKVLEETPSPAVDVGLRDRMGTAALALAGAVGYVGAGTCEFLLDDRGDFTFLEMNTRLQVEHPVTELVCGRDLVADQLRIAAGEPLGIAQHQVRLDGHAVEVRLYAEDAEADFLPATGRIERLRWPVGDGVRVDAGVQEGDDVGGRYDPMLAKIVARGTDRADALDRLARALDATVVLGLVTNLRFLRWLVRAPAVQSGQARTDTLERIWPPDDWAERVAIPDAAWSTAAARLDAAAANGDPWRNGFRLNGPRSIRLEAAGERRAVSPLDAGAVEAVRSGDVVHLDIGGRSIAFALASPPDVDRAARAAATHDGGPAELVAPMPGQVVAVVAATGATVDAGATILTIEAMKMEHAVAAPIAGRLTDLHVRAGDQVQRGQLLAVVEP